MDNKANMEIESNMKNWNEVSPKKKKKKWNENFQT